MRNFLSLSRITYAHDHLSSRQTFLYSRLYRRYIFDDKYIDTDSGRVIYVERSIEIEDVVRVEFHYPVLRRKETYINDFKDRLFSDRCLHSLMCQRTMKMPNN